MSAIAPELPLPPRGSKSTTFVIDSQARWGIDLRELWNYRGLFFFLVWRDIKVRYAQTVLGAGWAIVQPVLQMLVFTVIFGNFAKIPSDGVPYPVFSLAALVPWNYFSKALSSSSGSLLANTDLVTKVYFPRLVIPLAPVLAALVDFGIAFVILIGLMLAFGIVPSLWAFAVLPPLILAMVFIATGVGFWLSALNIRFRDVKYIVPFLVQIWMYASPIVYPMSIVPERWRPLYALNPMTGVIEGFRSVLLGTTPISPGLMAASVGTGFLLLLTGALYFRRTERIFADVA